MFVAHRADWPSISQKALGMWVSMAVQQSNIFTDEVFIVYPVETGLDHRIEDAYERRPAELGQGVQADFGPEERQSHRLLLRISPTGKSLEDEMRRVRVRLQEGKLLKKNSQKIIHLCRKAIVAH